MHFKGEIDGEVCTPLIRVEASDTGMEILRNNYSNGTPKTVIQLQGVDWPTTARRLAMLLMAAADQKELSDGM